MEDSQVITGIQLGFDKFKASEKKFKDILDIVKKAGFYECLNTSTKVYLDLVKEFYLYAVVRNEVITTKVNGINLKIGKIEINKFLDLSNEGSTALEDVNIEEEKRMMNYEKNPNLKGMKEFPEEYEFQAEIVGKCIMCKESAHDSVSDVQM